MTGAKLVLEVERYPKALDGHLPNCVRCDGRIPPVVGSVGPGGGDGPRQLAVGVRTGFGLKLRQEPRDAVGVPRLPRPRLDAVSRVASPALFVGGEGGAPYALRGGKLGAVPVGDVDNAAARRAMAECLPGDPRRWLIDAGNDTNWGQVLVGNVAEPVTLEEPPFEGDTCYLAPAPTLQRPDLLTAVSTRPPDVDCAAALDLTDQDPTINQMMASLVLQVVRRMVAGTCPFMALYLDMDLGTVTPTYVTPEAVERTVGTYVE